jgi:hypothetical protein
MAGKIGDVCPDKPKGHGEGTNARSTACISLMSTGRSRGIRMPRAALSAFVCASVVGLDPVRVVALAVVGRPRFAAKLVEFLPVRSARRDTQPRLASSNERRPVFQGRRREGYDSILPGRWSHAPRTLLGPGVCQRTHSRRIAPQSPVLYCKRKCGVSLAPRPPMRRGVARKRRSRL